MKNIFRLIVISIILVFIFNKKLIEFYYSKKFAGWIERDFKYEKFKVIYPNKIRIDNINIKNDNSKTFENILYAKLIEIEFDLKSLMFSKLVVIKDLIIENPKFYLEINEVIQSNSMETIKDKSKITYEDNIGLAKKISENLPDKIWPPKEKDINFVILNSKIINGKACINTFFKEEVSEIILSDMVFTKIGNEKGYQHHKDVLSIIFFDIYARILDYDLKKFLKELYKF